MSSPASRRILVVSGGSSNAFAAMLARMAAALEVVDAADVAHASDDGESGHTRVGCTLSEREEELFLKVEELHALREAAAAMFDRCPPDIGTCDPAWPESPRSADLLSWACDVARMRAAALSAARWFLLSLCCLPLSGTGQPWAEAHQRSSRSRLGTRD